MQAAPAEEATMACPVVVVAPRQDPVAEAGLTVSAQQKAPEGAVGQQPTDPEAVYLQAAARKGPVAALAVSVQQTSPEAAQAVFLQAVDRQGLAVEAAQLKVPAAVPAQLKGPVVAVVQASQAQSQQAALREHQLFASLLSQYQAGHSYSVYIFLPW